MNCLHSFRTGKSHEIIRKNKNFCRFLIPSGKDKILECNQYMKSNKSPNVSYTYIESLIKKNQWVFKQSRKCYSKKKKEKKVTANKRRTKIPSPPKSMSYLWKKNLRKVC